MTAIGNYCLFGYNVHVGMRKGIQLQDVFACFELKDSSFQPCDMKLLEDAEFEKDFQNLYRYYKDAFFSRFYKKGQFLYMLFQLSQNATDFKTFKWRLQEDRIIYVDNRSDHEVEMPSQYDFQWQFLGRDDHRQGKHAHISIEDQVFVEAIGGDITIKIEDNTDDGLGIYREEVEYKDQKLDDGQYRYANLGNLIAIAIKPYQEKERFFIYNTKVKEVQKVNALQSSGILLPEGQGLIFSNGYYLQTGEFKVFNGQTSQASFQTIISSPNGEDFLYVFYSPESGMYQLIFYNIIEQKVSTPTSCSGYCLYPSGHLTFFKAESGAVRHHSIQVWDTSFSNSPQEILYQEDNPLTKIGNKELVKGMSDCNQLIVLSKKMDNYGNLYHEILRKGTQILDAHHWISQLDSKGIQTSISGIKEAAQVAIDEYEKKVEFTSKAKNQLGELEEQIKKTFKQITHSPLDHIQQFVDGLKSLRGLRGRLEGLKEIRYIDLDKLQQLQVELEEKSADLSEQCVQYLAKPEALEPFQKSLEGSFEDLEEYNLEELLKKEEDLLSLHQQIDMLMNIVSNLKIQDSQLSTQIVGQISKLFAQINQKRNALEKIKAKKETEATREGYIAQMQLLDQTSTSYLDLSTDLEKCQEMQSKILVLVEEMESQFGQIEDFAIDLADKREQIFSAFDGKRKILLEAKNSEINRLEKSGTRLIKALSTRSNKMEEEEEIRTFFTTDLLSTKVRDLIRELSTLGASNKAQSLQAELKSTLEQALRNAKDKKELYVQGANVIRMGKHLFNTNEQTLELTHLLEGEDLVFHLTGTSYYETIKDPEILKDKEVWSMKFSSENLKIYRAEYLAFKAFNSMDQWLKDPVDFNKEATVFLQRSISSNLSEGYQKGIHDQDALAILFGLNQLKTQLGALRWNPQTRLFARFFWHFTMETSKKEAFEQQIKSTQSLYKRFPDYNHFDHLINTLVQTMEEVSEDFHLKKGIELEDAATYLIEEMLVGNGFGCGPKAHQIQEDFSEALKKSKDIAVFNASTAAIVDPFNRWMHIQEWIRAWALQANIPLTEYSIPEAALNILLKEQDTLYLIDQEPSIQLEDMRGNHAVIEENSYLLNYYDFAEKMRHFDQYTRPKFNRFQDRLRQLIKEKRAELQLDELQPKVLSSFIRNKLINEVYLPAFGDNFAKQLGTAGEKTRTDRMGLLLLVSPPGYGKTTLMEYMAYRLGLTFVKINGPAIGYEVCSLAPEDAQSMAGRKELTKLNTALEMGDNIMLYVDDIQHCNPKFLQKFISLCDAQRKIEGVFQGRAKTYDLRNKRVCVAMAGNPYTEGGKKFQIPDMLTNRADIFNLGDMTGNAKDRFKLSYLENALSSSGELSKLISNGLDDFYALNEFIDSGDRSALEKIHNYSNSELENFISVLQKMRTLRDILFQVNEAYIASAATVDNFRTQPEFKLQGSYRDMNKLTEKIIPLMNEEELLQLIKEHYRRESQSLSSNAESNLLALKSMLGWTNQEEGERWEMIKEEFLKLRQYSRLDDQSPMSRLLIKLDSFSEELQAISQAIANKN